jgi:hypothetical protein
VSERRAWCAHCPGQGTHKLSCPATKGRVTVSVSAPFLDRIDDLPREARCTGCLGFGRTEGGQAWCSSRQFPLEEPEATACALWRPAWEVEDDG